MSRRYRNRRIGEFLKDLELTEGRSTGIPKILRAMKANGSPAPIFEFDEDHSYFITKLRVHPAAAPIQMPATPQVTPPVTPPVAPPVRRLLEVLSDGSPKGMADIRGELGLKDRTHVRQQYVDPALATGLIEYTIPAKPNSRLQKYRLTDRGRVVLASIREAGL